MMNRSLAKLRRRAAKAAGKKTLRLETLEPHLTLSGGSLAEHVLGASPLLSALPKAKIPSQMTTLAPNADTLVNGGMPDTNFGLYPQLAAGEDGSGNQYQSFVRFDLHSVVGRISAAALRLTPVAWGAAVSSLTLNLSLLPDASDGWTEGTGGTTGSGLTWNTQPWSTGLSVTIPGSALKHSGPILIDVSSLVTQAWKANQVNTFEISVATVPTPNSFVCFASRESNVVGFRPALAVVSTGPLPAPPTVATAAQATPNPVTSTTTKVSVSGANVSGESTLTYTWSATTLPSGASAPKFSVNGTNAAKNATVTFSAAGTYGLTVTMTDGYGQRVTSTASVTVNQTPTRIAVGPNSASLGLGGTQQFAAEAFDQFGNALATSRPLTWTASGGGTISPRAFTPRQHGRKRHDQATPARSAARPA